MPLSALELQSQLVSRMSPEEKVRASEALRTAAWALKAAWLRGLHPDWTEAQVQEAVHQCFRDSGI
jgi:hypothetical protein